MADEPCWGRQDDPLGHGSLFGLPYDPAYAASKGAMGQSAEPLATARRRILSRSNSNLRAGSQPT